MKAFRGSMLVAVLVGMGLVCGQAQAAPLITFKVVALGAGGVETGDLQLEMTDIGRVLEIRVYAMIDSQTGGLDGLNKTLGSLASVQVAGASLLQGNLAVGVLGSGLAAVGSNVGTQRDLGEFLGVGAAPQFAALGDGDMDVGVISFGTATAGFIIPFAGTGNYVGGSEVLMYTTTFTVQDIPLGGETEIAFVPRYYSGANAAQKLNVNFKLDDTTYALNGNDERVGSSSLGISIIPEPATMALLALGGVVALLRRKRA